MASAEQVKQEIIDWANSDSVKDVFENAGWSESNYFADACRYLHEYLDTDETDADSGVTIPSGHCLRVKETHEGSALVVVFSVEAPGKEKQFFRFTGKLTSYEIYWNNSELREVFPKTVSVTNFD